MKNEIENSLKLSKNYELLRVLVKNKGILDKADDVKHYYYQQILENVEYLGISFEFLVLNTLFKNNFKLTTAQIKHLSLNRNNEEFKYLDVNKIKKMDFVNHVKFVFDEILPLLDVVSFDKKKVYLVKHYLLYIYKYSEIFKNKIFFNTLHSLISLLDLWIVDFYQDKIYLKQQIQVLYLLSETFVCRNFDVTPYRDNLKKIREYKKDKYLSIPEYKINFLKLHEVSESLKYLQNLLDELYSSKVVYDVLRVMKEELNTLLTLSIRNFKNINNEMLNYRNYCDEILIGEKNVDFSIMLEFLMKCQTLIFKQNFNLQKDFLYKEQLYFSRLTDSFTELVLISGKFRRRNSSIYFFNRLINLVVKMQYDAYLADHRFLFDVFKDFSELIKSKRINDLSIHRDVFQLKKLVKYALSSCVDFQEEDNNKIKEFINKDEKLIRILGVKKIKEQENVKKKSIQLAKNKEKSNSEKEAKESVQDVVDEEIIDIFLEESDEIKSNIELIFKGWETDLLNEKYPEEIRKELHTLKGGAKMIKQKEVAELIHDFEYFLLNTVGNKQQEVIEFSLKIKKIIFEIIEDLKNKINFEEIVNTRKLIKKKEIDINKEEFLEEDIVDDELLEIYYEEAEEIDEQIVSSISEWKSDLKNSEYVDSIKRDLHTLKGGAKMIKQKELSEVIHLFEDFLVKLQLDGNEEIINFCLDVQSFIINAIKKITSKEVPLGFNEIKNKISNYSAKNKNDEENQDDDVVDDDLIEIYCEEEEELYEGMLGHLSSWREDLSNLEYAEAMKRDLHTLKGGAKMVKQKGLSEVIHTLEEYIGTADSDIKEDFVNYCEKILGNIHSNVNKIKNKEKLGKLDEIITEIKNKIEENQYNVVDNELIEIFVEEATEINMEIQQHLSSWSDDLNNEEYVDNIKRDLHTLKGGAKMIKQKDLSKVIHAFEDFLINLPLTIDKELVDFCRNVQDKIFLNIKGLESGGSLEDVSDLRNELDNFVAHTASGSSEVDDVVIDIFLDEALDLSGQAFNVFKEFEEDKSNYGKIKELSDIMKNIEDGCMVLRQTKAKKFIKLLLNLYMHIYNKKNKITEDVFKMLISSLELLGEVLANIKAKVPIPDLSVVIKLIDDYIHTSKMDNTSLDKSVENVPKNSKRDKPPASAFTRINTIVLEKLDELSIESNISRVSIEHISSGLKNNLVDMDVIIDKMGEQMKQISSSIVEKNIDKRKYIQKANQNATNQIFDELEMDEYTEIHKWVLDMGEVVGDLRQVMSSMMLKSNNVDISLMKQFRIGREIQDTLSGIRLISFSTIIPRLQRIVRQVSSDLSKKVNFEVLFAEGTVDKALIEKVIPSLEHLIRNAIDHGIESESDRKKLGKLVEGKLTISLKREGQNIIIVLSDDGGGIDKDAVLKKIKEKGMLDEGVKLTDSEIYSFLFLSGFSTREKVTEISGRGVGLDVVSTEIKKLGGVLEISSEKAKGTSFFIKLPFSFSMNKSLIFEINSKKYGIPLLNIQGIGRIHKEEISEYLDIKKEFKYLKKHYKIFYLGNLLGVSNKPDVTVRIRIPLILFDFDGDRYGFIVDKLFYSKEIVIQSLGTQFTHMTRCAGASLLGDGSVVYIVDPISIVKMIQKSIAKSTKVVENKIERKTVMVVDDSVTVRKITSKFLKAKGFDVLTAKDGMDAIQRMEKKPDLFLLDLEMPRMDGYEFTTYIRNDVELKNIPIIMITSRTGEKHKNHALELGVTKFLGKPYQEDELLEIMKDCLNNSKAG